MNYTVRNLVVALVLAALGVVLLLSYVSTREKQLTRGQEVVEVLVAQQNIPAGTPANRLETDGYVALEKVRREDRVPQALGSLKELEKQSVNATIYEGFQLSARNFATTTGLNPADQIKGNERVIAIPLAPGGAVGNQLQPGDHIDVFAHVSFKPFPGAQQTWNMGVIGCRGCIVLQTPGTIEPKEDDAPGASADSKGDAQLYTIQTTDEQAYELSWMLANAENGLVAWQRPSTGANETELELTDAMPPGLQDRVEAQWAYADQLFAQAAGRAAQGK